MAQHPLTTQPAGQSPALALRGLAEYSGSTSRGEGRRQPALTLIHARHPLRAASSMAGEELRLPGRLLGGDAA